jgi:predicted nuclease with TOPRIM domain
MNNEIEAILKSIKTKLSQLLAEKAMWQKEKTQLQQKLASTADMLKSKEIELALMDDKLKAVQMLQEQLSDADKKELSKSIDQHIANIEKTITLLSE